MLPQQVTIAAGEFPGSRSSIFLELIKESTENLCLIFYCICGLLVLRLVLFELLIY